MILTFDAKDWWDTLAKPLRQGEMHREGARSLSKCFVHTGSTNWGIQNLEYDAYLQRWILAVYRGKKPRYPNYDMFFISATATPKLARHDPYGEEILELPLCGEGIAFPYGSTGTYAFGDGRYYFSQHGRDPQKGQYTHAVLYQATGREQDPFAPTA